MFPVRGIDARLLPSVGLTMWREESSSEITSSAAGAICAAPEAGVVADGDVGLETDAST